MMNLEEIVNGISAELINCSENLVDVKINKISTDTRTIRSGDFYLPLKGANFDGEKFIPQALEKCAVGYFYDSK